MKVTTTTESVLALAAGLDAGRGVQGPSPLAAVLRALVGERDAAVAIVERLPKTADGVPVGPGDVVYTLYGAEWRVQDATTAAESWMDGDPCGPIADCYSTREAAAGAKP